MKIALVVPGGVDPSGERRVIPALLALLARLARRHEVHVFALAQQDQPGSWDLAGARIHNIGVGATRWLALRAICAEHRSHGFQLIQSIWSGSPGWIAVSAARVLGVPSLVHVAGGELVALRELPYGGCLTWKGRMREALVLRAATAVTAASAPMLAALTRKGIAAARVPLGVDLDVWPPREPLRRDPGKPARLLHIGSLNRVKDQPTLLRAVRALGAQGLEFKLDIVGEDTLGGEIQALAARWELSTRVRFHGFLTQRELVPLVDAAHILMMSSRHEAGPLVLLEAGVRGVPTVGTAVGHVAEWAPQAARAVPVGDWAALARETADLLRNEDGRLQIARAAWRRAVLQDADYTAQAFEKIYGELTASRRSTENVSDANAGS